MLCARSVPSMNRFIDPPLAAKNQCCQNLMKQVVFTQPGSFASVSARLTKGPVCPQKLTLRRSDAWGPKNIWVPSRIADHTPEGEGRSDIGVDPRHNVPTQCSVVAAAAPPAAIAINSSSVSSCTDRADIVVVSA